MNHCEHCVWWGGGPLTPADKRIEVDQYGRKPCQQIEHEAGHEALASVHDYEGFDATLRTAPTFGCVLWTERT